MQSAAKTEADVCFLRIREGKRTAEAADRTCRSVRFVFGKSAGGRNENISKRPSRHLREANLPAGLPRNSRKKMQPRTSKPYAIGGRACEGAPREEGGYGGLRLFIHFRRRVASGPSCEAGIFDPGTIRPRTFGQLNKLVNFRRGRPQREDAPRR